MDDDLDNKEAPDDKNAGNGSDDEDEDESDEDEEEEEERSVTLGKRKTRDF